MYLVRYIRKFLSETELSKILTGPVLTQLTVGLVVVMGSLFYPKEMAKYYASA